MISDSVRPRLIREWLPLVATLVHAAAAGWSLYRTLGLFIPCIHAPSHSCIHFSFALLDESSVFLM